MKTQKDYIEWLNSIAPEYESEEWIMGGKRRERFAASGKFGECIKRHDPIRFKVGFNEFKNLKR